MLLSPEWARVPLPEQCVVLPFVLAPTRAIQTKHALAGEPAQLVPEGLDPSPAAHPSPIRIGSQAYTWDNNCNSCIGFGDDECDAVDGGDGAQSQVTFTPEDETYFSWTNCCEGLFTTDTPTGVNFYISVECS